MITGKTRYRQGWRGKIILQVEESMGDVAWFLKQKWRDATFIDVMSIERGDFKLFTPDIPPPKKEDVYISQPGLPGWWYSSGGYTDKGAEIAAALRNEKSSPHKESPKNSPWWKY